MREKSWRSGYGAWRRAGLIDTFGAREDEGVSGMTSRARRVRVVFQVRAETARADAVYPIVHVRDALPAPGPWVQSCACAYTSCSSRGTGLTGKPEKGAVYIEKCTE